LRLCVFALSFSFACTSLNSPVARHSASIAISHDGTHLYVVNPDSDSVSIIDATTGTLEHEVLLAPSPPAVDAGGHFTPAVMPRAVAISPHSNRLYVTGERSSRLHVVDAGSGKVLNTIEVCSEPAGVLVSPDENSVYVACSNDDEVVRVDTGSHKVVTTVQTEHKPWALAWSADGKSILVTHLLGNAVSSDGAGISVLESVSLHISSTWAIADTPPRSDPRLAYGQARGLYDVVQRPGSSEIWVAHLLLANLTAQPTLNFENTVFPCLSVFKTWGNLDTQLYTDAQDVPGTNGAFGDVVSGPHSFEFTPDGHYALMADTYSEDVLAVDAVNRVEAALVRPLPGHMPQGIVLSPDGKHAYVDERNTGDVAVLDIDETATPISVTVEPKVIPRITSDPMPAAMRLGQHLFHSANSDELPITQNHWVACASCHVEGRSDSVTWEFLPGPRDTPSNAGGTLDTGFLLHTAERRVVQDYWHVINVEQGGRFSPSDPTQSMQLDALEAFVDHALPIPVPPHTNASLVAQGKAIFERSDVGCTNCHYGPALTDSGAGNPALDLMGVINLHDVGTCNTGQFPDVPSTADDGSERAACKFDTPALRGLADSAPYFHDGSALTLRDALERTRGKMGNINGLSDSEENALIEYLRSL
jgi:YVTN family beta-propeller protein